MNAGESAKEAVRPSRRILSQGNGLRLGTDSRILTTKKPALAGLIEKTNKSENIFRQGRSLAKTRGRVTVDGRWESDYRIIDLGWSRIAVLLQSYENL